MMPISNPFSSWGPFTKSWSFALGEQHMLILNPAVEASTYACFERSTVEEVAISEIEMRSKSAPPLPYQHRLPSRPLSGGTPSKLMESSPFELLTEDLIRQLGIGLASGFLHQLANEEALQLGLAAAERLHLIGMGRK